MTIRKVLIGTVSGVAITIGSMGITTTTTLVGATALSVATSTAAIAGKKRKVKRAMKHLDKANAASAAGDHEKAAYHYDRANTLMDKVANGVVADPNCDRPGVTC